jgi:uncharacterized protein
LVQKNLQSIKAQSGISPAFDGTVSSLQASMANSGVNMSIVNNVVLKADLMRKANDWTSTTVSNHQGLTGMGYVIAGDPESASEVERCATDLHFKAIKMHHSHSKIFPGDSRNYPIYEKIVVLGIPVLFHCGKNPYSRDSAIQYSASSGFSPVLSSFPEMKVVMAHLAGCEDYKVEALDLLQNFRNVVADTAIEAPSKVNIADVVAKIGIEKIVFGSDYPIRDPAILISWLRDSLSQPDFDAVTSKNPMDLFDIE